MAQTPNGVAVFICQIGTAVLLHHPALLLGIGAMDRKYCMEKHYYSHVFSGVR